MSMQKSRKIIAVLFTVFVLGFVPTAETQAESGGTTKDGLSYILVNDPSRFYEHSATITGYSGSKSNLSIPEKIKGAYVDSIDESAFFGNSSLTQVKFHPDVSLEIGRYAFGDCCNLSLVDLPDTIFRIGWGAFFACSNLKTVKIPSNIKLKRIEPYTFDGCSNLTSVVIPSNVTYIGQHAFSDCSSLTSLDIPPSVTSIEEFAFYGCDRLTITGYAGSYAETYAKTNNISFIALETGSIEDMFSYKDDQDSAVITGFNGLDVIISVPAQVNGMTVSRIGGGAFRNMNLLVSMTLPSGVASIGDWAFFGCSSLKDVSLPESLTSIGDWAFSKCVSLMAADIPSGVKSIGAGAFSGCSSLTSLSIPFGVTDIGEAAFRKCSGLETVDISFSVTSIGDYAFYGCSSLTKVTIPSRVSSIGKDAFLYSPAVILGYAGSYAEAYAQEHSIPFVVIDTQASGITESGFSYDINGEELTITGYAGSDIDIALPEFIEGFPVTGIGEMIFSANRKDCSIASLTVPSGITRIDANAFDGCPGLMIFGYKGSNLETYARNASIPFTALDEQTEPTPPPYQELTLGSRGQEVLDMKGRFLELGYFRTAEFSDQFNKNTADTVKLFEKNNGLPADGVADPTMLALLFSDGAVGK